MENKLYVSNLAFSVQEDSLRQEFSKYGTVVSASVMLERDTGRSRGFAFVEMGTQSEAQDAIGALNGKSLEGRALNVSIARPREINGGAGRPGSSRPRW